MNFRQLSRLTDSQETASIKEARKLLVEKAGMTDEQADKWVRGDLRATFPILRDKKAAKFILGTTRLFVEQQLNDADAQNKLTRVLKEINEAHYDEFDRNLNGKSLSELYSPLESKFKEADKATREASSSKQFGKSDYKIYGPYDSFEQAKKAWGNRSQDWCVFHRKDMYVNYTSAGQRFYVAAQNGWESVPREVGVNAPKDAYGNSLIAISVDIEGNLATSTPRWNHANGGGDNTYTLDELEDILQMPFYDTFKPYTDDERRARGIVSFAEAAERLASGEDPHDIFSVVGNFHEGLAAVELNGKCNFIDTHNNLLSDQWFDRVGSFCEGLAFICLNGKWNLLDTHNNLLSDQWFDYAGDFHEGFAVVESDSRWNFINTEGNLLSDQWFDNAYYFHEGFADVKSDGRWHRINTEGRIVDSKRTSNLNCKKLLKLSDSQETASIKEARKLLVEKAGMTDEQADKWVRGDLRAAFPILRDKKAAKFILGTTRLFVEQQLNDADAQNKLTRVLKEINEAHYDEFDRNLNGKSLQDLYSPFEQTFKEADKATREASSNKQFDKSDYTIHGPYDSFEQAKKAWGNRSQDWCVFHMKDMYDNYTSAGQRFYVAAHNGWESVPNKVGDNAPKDAYGNSLIAISVDLEGNLATSTPRWNHAHGGGDNTYTVDELEDILQMPFYETFKPYTEEERRARGIMSFKEAAERLASGEDPHDIFSAVGDFQEGFARVKLNNRYNFIDTHNNLLSDQWFGVAMSFREGFARVNLNGKWNLLDIHNNLLSDQWFDSAVGDFHEGFAVVESDSRWNFINTEGNLLSDQWFDYVDNFQKGFAVVKLNGKWNFINTEGNLLSDQWFDYAGDFHEGFAHVNLNGKHNFIDTQGNLLSDQWFDYVDNFQKGFAAVKLNRKWNFINTEGNLLSDQWFDYASGFYSGFSHVELNRKRNFIDTKGNFLSSQWFDSACNFHEGFADVKLDGKYNFIDTEGNLLSDQWFDSAGYFHEGFADVKSDGRWHRINTEGRIVDSKITSNLNCKKLLKLSDSQETASIKEARKLLVEKANMTDEQADKWVRGALRAAFPILRDKKAAKFILGTTRLFVEQQLNDADAQNKMSKVLKEINEAHYDEFDRNLNGKSLSELYSPLESKFKEADKATREASSGKSFGKSDYKIYGPYDSFEQAEEEWGNNSQDWCVFHDEDAFNNYTSAGQRFYVAAHNGWESVPREVGVDAPKDAYGNSLIAISVDIEGNLATSTPRWNHANGGGDSTYTVDELEDILQMPFYETFKPYTEEERRARGIVSFAEAAERLASGEDPHDIFSVVGNFYEGSACVKLNNRYNFIDTHNNLLFDQWFDSVGDFQEGFAAVRLNGKWNFINTEGNLLSDQWFDRAGNFQEGFAAVKLNGKWNLLDIHNNLLSDQWFDNALDFHEGFAAVKLNGKCNFIDTEGNFLSDQWFDYTYYYFDGGFAAVKLNGKWNFINTEGNLLSDQWFDHVGDFQEGFATVKLNGKWNFINTEGNLLSDQWFDRATAFNGGFADVFLNGRWHYINTSGRIVDSKRTSNLNCKKLLRLSDSQETASIKKAAKRLALGEDPHDIFDYVYAVHEGFSCVQLRDKYNFIDTNGNFLSSQWFDYAGDFYEGFATVKLNGKWNYIDTEGNFLLDQWFDVAYSFHDGFACVWLKSKWNFIDTKGNFLSDRWFDDSIDFRDGVVRVKLDSGWHLIDKYGTILDSKRTYNLNCKKLLKHIK